MTQATLRFRDVERRFGRLRVLSGVSGEVGSGEILLVRGHNGSGKSTLLRCLVGLMRPDRGEIESEIDGRALGVDDRRRRCGYVAPDLTFYPELTTAENLELFARLRHVDRDRIPELLDAVDLTPRRATGALSSGMYQRLRWAWALLHEPPLLFLDEPFQNLDPEGTERLGTLLDRHLAEGGLAVVASPGPIALPGPAHELTLS